jgi:hypothetical protein
MIFTDHTLWPLNLHQLKHSLPCYDSAWTPQELCFSFAETFTWYGIISGFYETRVAYYSWRGAQGYTFASIPDY